MEAGLAAALAGCAGMKKKDLAARLDQALSAYAGAIRWGNYETAAAFAVPRAAAPRVVDPSALSGLKVPGYSERFNRVNEAGDEAEVSLSFTYYQETRGTLRTVEQDATWYYDDEREVWLMDAGLPAFEARAPVTPVMDSRSRARG